MCIKIDRCKLGAATKQAILPIQITPELERYGDGNKNPRRNKRLYSNSCDGIEIFIRYQVNEKTGHTGVYTYFHGVQKCYAKSLYYSDQEGVQTQVKCVFNPKTASIGIVTGFGKRRGWNGGASTNHNCSIYLGVVVAERVLSEVFKNVERMPQGNKGYDVVCGSGYKIDIKSACHTKNEHTRWAFKIKRNQVADYFLCLAFDNREDLNPQYVWLIPASVVNHLMGAGISISTLDKWAEYELTDKLDDVISCCDTMKKLDD